MEKDTVVVAAQPEAASVVAAGLSTLTQGREFLAGMVSHELQLSAQIADLSRTRTIIKALLDELDSVERDLVRRQTALQSSRTHIVHRHW